MSKYVIKTFYAFSPLPEDQLESFRARATELAQEKDVIGLVIMGKEGFNTTLAADNEKSLDLFAEQLLELLQLTGSVSRIKTSFSEKRPFKRFNVKLRSEIVTLGKEEYVPEALENRHLSPEKWHEYLQREDVVVIDTRNTYETEVGKFKKAIDLEMDEFREFPEKLKALNTDKSKPHLIYCTGGIRCEKAIFEMQKQGFENSFQLEGGILNYLEQKPHEDFEGECFVFDSRVSVTQDLKPSEQYSLCPHCGDVSNTPSSCKKCDSDFLLCPKCDAKKTEDPSLETCSKNCRHHYQLRPEAKGPQQKQFFHQTTTPTKN